MLLSCCLVTRSVTSLRLSVFGGQALTFASLHIETSFLSHASTFSDYLGQVCISRSLVTVKVTEEESVFVCLVCGWSSFDWRAVLLVAVICLSYCPSIPLCATVLLISVHQIHVGAASRVARFIAIVIIARETLLGCIYLVEYCSVFMVGGRVRARCRLAKEVRAGANQHSRRGDSDRSAAVSTAIWTSSAAGQTSPFRLHFFHTFHFFLTRHNSLHSFTKSTYYGT